MTTTERSMVIGVFETRTQADRAMGELEQAGFAKDQIGFAVRDETTEDTMLDGAPQSDKGATVAAGAVSGGVVGGVVGAAAALLIPGFGPALAGGILVATLGGVAIGAAAGSLVGALVGMGVPEEDARYYESEFKIGRTIVTVNAPGHEHQASEILHRNGAYDATTRFAASRPDTPDTDEVNS